jgi:bleomycin hydrolase
MKEKMMTYLDSIKESNSWNEELVAKGIKNILNRYMGAPPTEFTYQGKKYNPQAFLKEEVKLNMNDYYNFMSTLSADFMQKSELVEADNWRHEDDYYNLNCNDFTTTLLDALKKDYSVCICGDISEPGIDSFNEGAYIPTFDIPQEFINDDARQLRLSDGSTTDDHCMHAVGWYFDGKYNWFLFKDSGAGGFDGPNKGYRFIREDFVKMKMMNIMMHKNAAPILNKIIK